MCGRALHPRDLAPGCDEGAMVVPTSLFSTAAQNADPSHHRYLDRCTHCTPATRRPPQSTSEPAPARRDNYALTPNAACPTSRRVLRLQSECAAAQLTG